MINIKNPDLYKIKTDEKSYKNIFTYHVGYLTVKDLSYAKINSINPLNLNIDRTNGYIEQCNGNKYLSLVPTDESRDILKNVKNCGVKLEI